MSTYHNPLCEEGMEVAPVCQDCQLPSIAWVNSITRKSFIFCPDHLPGQADGCTYHVFAEADSLHQLAFRYPSASISDVLLNGTLCWDHDSGPSRHEADAVGCGISGPGFVPFCYRCIQPNRKEYGFSMWWGLQVSREDAIKVGRVDGYYLTPGGWNPLLGRWGGWDEPGEVTIP